MQDPELFLSTVTKEFSTALEIARRHDVSAEYRGNLLTMRFADGHRSTLTRQDSIQQVWLADGPTTWQFECRSESAELTDYASGDELLSVITAMIARQAGSGHAEAAN